MTERQLRIKILTEFMPICEQFLEEAKANLKSQQRVVDNNKRELAKLKLLEGQEE